MKNLICLSIIFLFFSCASNRIIEDYINNTSDTEKIYINKNKVAPIVAVNILRGINYPIPIEKEIDYSGSKLYTTSQYDDLHTKYNNDTISASWSNKDFKNIEVQFVDGVFTYMRKKKGTTVKTALYSASKPLFLENKKQVFFFISKSYSNSNFSRVVLMKKTAGKWKVIEEIENYELH